MARNEDQGTAFMAGEGPSGEVSGGGRADSRPASTRASLRATGR